jgi:hypothetical protein
MGLLELHPWFRFGVGLAIGCWIGVAIGIGIAILLAARRAQQLEMENAQLREKLKASEKPRWTGTGPSLVSGTGFNRSASALRRAAGGGR